MTELSVWFAERGVPPLVLGLVLGVLLALVFGRLVRAKKDDGRAALGQVASIGGGQRSTIGARGTAISLPPEVLVAVEHALARGNKIEAIKHVRDAARVDLMTAKNFVESLEGRAGR